LIVALTIGIVVCVAMNFKKFEKVGGLGKSSQIAILGSLLAIMNTGSEVGYGSVIASLSGFKTISDFLMTIHIGNSPLLSEALMVNVIAGVTGSASGGLGIAMELMGKTYLEWGVQAGVSPELIHRIASLASGGMDTLPHNGAVITLLAICGLNHRQSYGDIFALTCFKTIVAFLMVLLVSLFPII
jgi:H+/gluconate symporter-like permease